MSNLKILALLLLGAMLLTGLALPVFAMTYNSGVTVGQYVKYGNFSGMGPGVEAFNDYDWLKLQVTDVSGNAITLLSISQFKNGTAIPGSGVVKVWNVETGTENDAPSTQGPIIAANLKQGDAIPPPNTYVVNSTETRTYLGVSRVVNVLDVSFSTPDYSTSLTYVYDQVSGMLLESATQTVTQAQPQPITTTISYSITETNIFGSATIPSPTVPEFPIQTLYATLLIVSGIVALAPCFRRKEGN